MIMYVYVCICMYIVIYIYIDFGGNPISNLYDVVCEFHILVFQTPRRS